MSEEKKTTLIRAGIAVVAILFIGCIAWGLVFNSDQDSSKADDQTKFSDDSMNSSSDEFWVLVVGNDSRTGTVEASDPAYSDGKCRSDTMILVYVDLKQKKIALLTIPRDTAVVLDDKTVKLNSRYESGGIEALEQEVKALTGVTPKYYIDTTFVGFEKIVDGLGGIKANLPIDMSLDDIVSGEKINLAAGEQDLGGKEALVYVRQRKQYADDLDACRQIQDRAALQAMITKVASTPSIQSVAIDVLMANSKTNFTSEELKKYVEAFSQDAEAIQFVSGTGPYKGGIDIGADNQWVAVREEATWKELIATAQNFGDLNSIVAPPEVRAK